MDLACLRSYITKGLQPPQQDWFLQNWREEKTCFWISLTKVTQTQVAPKVRRFALTMIHPVLATTTSCGRSFARVNIRGVKLFVTLRRPRLLRLIVAKLIFCLAAWSGPTSWGETVKKLDSEASLDLPGATPPPDPGKLQ